MIFLAFESYEAYCRSVAGLKKHKQVLHRV